jgi:hypothetical protein
MDELDLELLHYTLEDYYVGAATLEEVELEIEDAGITELFQCDCGGYGVCEGASCPKCFGIVIFPVPVSIAFPGAYCE